VVDSQPHFSYLNAVRGSWNRDANATELVAYLSMVGPAGTRDVGSSFYVTYTYLQPGEGFANRYMAWRNVTVRRAPQQIGADDEDSTYEQ
jgi:hypothetical protein